MKPVELHPPADRLAHEPGELDLRALRRLGHGDHRRREDRPALLRARALAGLLRRGRDRWERFTGREAVRHA